MSELRLAGSLISWSAQLLPPLPKLNYGHFQVVLYTNEGEQREIEVDAFDKEDIIPTLGHVGILGKWRYHPEQDHIGENKQNTLEYGDPDKYKASPIDLEGRSAENAWEILKQVNDQFRTYGTHINYDHDKNSNSYVTTLLSVIGENIADYAAAATPKSVKEGVRDALPGGIELPKEDFPGQGKNVLEIPGDAIALNLNGTVEADIIHTGLANDTLRGGAGSDSLSGGGGHDTYVYGSVVDSLYDSQQSLNLLQNGSFEEGSGPGVYLPLTPGSKDITGWEVIRGGIDYIGTDWVSSDGNRSLDLNGTPGVGGVAQTFATIPGEKYHVSFDLSGHYSGLIQELGVSAAGQSARITIQSGTDPNNLGWKEYTWDFTANAPQTTLEFYSLQTGYPYGGPALDDVVVTGFGTDKIKFDSPGPVFGDTINLLEIDANAEIAGQQSFTFPDSFLGTSAPADGNGAGKIWVADASDPSSGNIAMVYASVDSDNAPELAIWVDDGAATAVDWTYHDFIPFFTLGEDPWA